MSPLRDRCRAAVGSCRLRIRRARHSHCWARESSAKPRISMAIHFRRLSGFLLGLAVANSALAGASSEVPIGEVLREATLQGLNGPSRKLSEFRGRPLIIN